MKVRSYFSRKLTMFLKTLSLRLKRLALYLELKKHIKQKESYLLYVPYSYRGIGKTYNLVKLALKYDVPIFVPNLSELVHLRLFISENFKFRRKMLKTKHFKVIVVNEHVRIYDRYSMGLIDEGIDEEVVNKIIAPQCKNIVGYR